MAREGILFLTLAALVLGIRAQNPPEAEDDVTAAYDYDGTLILDSRNFRGMTSTGIWVVMFYSYSVVIRDTQEAYDCQTFSYLWGNIAEDFADVGGTPNSGSNPTIHIAKFDTSYDSERRFVSLILQSERIEALPALVIFDGDNVVAFPPSEMKKITENFPNIDQLIGYSPDLECDPPADHYEAGARNEINKKKVMDWINGYLMKSRDAFIEMDPYPERIRDEANVDWDWDGYDPTEAVIESAQEAIRLGDVAGFKAKLQSMEAVNGTGINCVDAALFQTPLHFAATAGQTEVAELLIEMGCDVEAVCRYGDTPLTKAAESGRRGVVRALIRGGAEINAPRRDDGATALHMAALAGHGDICTLLIRAGADIEARTPRGLSPLHFAAMGGYVHDNNAVDALIKAGADLEGKDYKGWNALMWASWVNEPKMMEKLCELGADMKAQDLDGDTPLHHAMHNGFESHVRILLRHGADVFAENRLGEKAKDILACWDNWDQDPLTGEVIFTKVAKKKFDAILRPHVMWWWPGFYVFPFMRTDVEHKLRQVDKSVLAWVTRQAGDFFGYLKRNWQPFFKMFLTEGGGFVTKYERFTQRRLSEIEEFYDMQTAGGDHTGDVWLFDMGDPEYERMKSYSELQRAVYTGQAWLVEKLLKEGGARYFKTSGIEADLSQILIPSNNGGLDPEANGDVRSDPGDVDIEIRDENGSTPIMMASSRNDFDSMRVLARYGADLDSKDKYGWTALMRAAHEGRAKVVDFLLEQGATPDRANYDNDRETAMMLACAAGHLNIVKQLMRHGADIDRQDALGRTPMNYAYAMGRSDIVTWLRDVGATMRENGVTHGYPLDFEKPKFSGYNPADDPEGDFRNPRFTGSMN